MPKREPPDLFQPPTTITFRFDNENAVLLAERAARLKVSPHELAREYVLQALHEAEERAALHAAVIALRQDVGTAAGALLTSAGKMTREDALAWVKENIP
ncbi:MAG: hypothetical protein AB7O66_21330 [Limisphaerales bacterium]